MDNNEIERDFDSVLVPMEDAESVAQHSEDELTAIKISNLIMQEFEPAFVLIASPNMRMTERGFLFPMEVGLSINEDLGITRSVAAAVLREIADMLDEDINKVMNFVREATGSVDE